MAGHHDRPPLLPRVIRLKDAPDYLGMDRFERRLAGSRNPAYASDFRQKALSVPAYGHLSARPFRPHPDIRKEHEAAV